MSRVEDMRSVGKARMLLLAVDPGTALQRLPLAAARCSYVQSGDFAAGKSSGDAVEIGNSSNNAMSVARCHRVSAVGRRGETTT